MKFSPVLLSSLYALSALTLPASVMFSFLDAGLTRTFDLNESARSQAALKKSQTKKRIYEKAIINVSCFGFSISQRV
ncbi:hypothetical protein SAMN05216524_103364 [Mucilaginibacter sp. OK098]|nr:hypothetical protein SAMN05216524_103364 [Mucilaginibacter sp. OK098]